MPAIGEQQADTGDHADKRENRAADWATGAGMQSGLPEKIVIKR